MQLGLVAIFVCPNPNWPQSLAPNVKTRPLSATKQVCSSPHAICVTLSLRIQNLFGELSANLLLPKVKTAPVSKTIKTTKSIMG